MSKTKRILGKIKQKAFTTYQSLKTAEIETEEKTIDYSLVDLGWDLEKTKYSGSEEYDSFYLTPTKCILKQKVLSGAEKFIVSQFLREIQETPFESVESSLEKLFTEFCESKNIVIDSDQKQYLLSTLNNELAGFGPLSIFLDSKYIEEIAINGINVPLYVYIINKGWYETNFYFTSEQYLKEIINKMSRTVGRRITLSNPILNASLKDGSRLNAILKPVVNSELSVTIRKFRYEPLTPIDLINYDSVSLEIMAFFALAMQAEVNILIAGNTGSGKTTLLNSLFSFVPLDERIIITEETPEINIPHAHKVSLKVNLEQKINMVDLIKTTLRMRPDRVIVGEIRTKEEVNAYLDTILAGQGKGSYATFHGLSIPEAISRLKNLGLTDQDLNALDLIILQKRWTEIQGGKKLERRKIFEIAEIIDSKPYTLYKYNPQTKTWEKVRESQKVKEKIELVFGKKYSVLFNETKDYIEFLAENKDLKIAEFCKMFNNFILS